MSKIIIDLTESNLDLQATRKRTNLAVEESPNKKHLQAFPAFPTELWVKIKSFVFTLSFTHFRLPFYKQLLAAHLSLLPKPSIPLELLSSFNLIEPTSYKSTFFQLNTETGLISICRLMCYAQMTLTEGIFSGINSFMPYSNAYRIYHFKREKGQVFYTIDQIAIEGETKEHDMAEDEKPTEYRNYNIERTIQKCYVPKPITDELTWTLVLPTDADRFIFNPIDRRFPVFVFTSYARKMQT